MAYRLMWNNTYFYVNSIFFHLFRRHLNFSILKAQPPPKSFCKCKLIVICYDYISRFFIHIIASTLSTLLINLCTGKLHNNNSNKNLNWQSSTILQHKDTICTEYIVIYLHLLLCISWCLFFNMNDSFNEIRHIILPHICDTLQIHKSARILNIAKRKINITHWTEKN